MEKITEILLAKVVSEDGEPLGRVADLRSNGEPEHGESNKTRVITELLYGKSGWLELVGLRKATLHSVPWKSVKKIEPDKIVIKVK